MAPVPHPASRNLPPSGSDGASRSRSRSRVDAYHQWDCSTAAIRRYSSSSTVPLPQQGAGIHSANRKDGAHRAYGRGCPTGRTHQTSVARHRRRLAGRPRLRGVLPRRRRFARQTPPADQPTADLGRAVVSADPRARLRAPPCGVAAWARWLDNLPVLPALPVQRPAAARRRRADARVVDPDPEPRRAGRRVRRLPHRPHPLQPRGGDGRGLGARAAAGRIDVLHGVPGRPVHGWVRVGGAVGERAQAMARRARPPWWPPRRVRTAR